MGRLIDIDKAREEYRNLIDLTMSDTTLLHTLYGVLDTAPTVEAIPREEVRQFIENIQKIKDNHNEYGEPINYGTICGILIEGYRLLDKYKEVKEDGNVD